MHKLHICIHLWADLDKRAASIDTNSQTQTHTYTHIRSREIWGVGTWEDGKWAKCCSSRKQRGNRKRLVGEDVKSEADGRRGGGWWGWGRDMHPFQLSELTHLRLYAAEQTQQHPRLQRQTETKCTRGRYHQQYYVHKAPPVSTSERDEFSINRATRLSNSSSSSSCCISSRGWWRWRWSIQRIIGFVLANTILRAGRSGWEKQTNGHRQQ